MCLGNLGRHKIKIILKSTTQKGWTLKKLDVALRILGMAPKVDEKGVALKVGEKAASHRTPLGTPGRYVGVRR